MQTGGRKVLCTYARGRFIVKGANVRNEICDYHQLSAAVTAVKL
jgi:hypothetical protein